MSDSSTSTLLEYNLSTIFKLTLLFWTLVLIQVKMSPHARQFIFKTLYVIAGILSIFGAIGTTGMLIYKYKSIKL